MCGIGIVAVCNNCMHQVEAIPMAMLMLKGNIGHSLLEGLNNGTCCDSEVEFIEGG